MKTLSALLVVALLAGCTASVGDDSTASSSEGISAESIYDID